MKCWGQGAPKPLSAFQTGILTRLSKPGIAASYQDLFVRIAIAAGSAARSWIEGRLFASKLALADNSLGRIEDALDLDSNSPRLSGNWPVTT